MSEHITALFEGQDLSEEFKVKASAIIATAIDEARAELESTLQEEADKKLQEKIAELDAQVETYIAEEILPNVDKYLTAAVNEWADDNKIALEESAKVELAESFLTGLVGLAESHNLNIPQSEFDKVAKLEEKLAEMKEQVTTLIDRNIELQESNKSFVRNSIIDSVTAELSESQKEKIVTVSDKVEFISESQFKESVKSLVESYFPVETQPEVESEPEVKPTQQISESYASKLVQLAI